MEPFLAASIIDGAINTITDISQNQMAKLPGRFARATAVGSLIDASSAARVEPLCIVSGDCIHLEYLPDVLQSLQSIFTGYYLQAIAMTAEIGNVKVVKLLDALNPNRNASVFSLSTESMKNQWRLCKESYKYRLPKNVNHSTVSMEAVNPILNKYAKFPRTEAELEQEADQNRVLASVTDKSMVDSKELADLSVGKLVNVTICNGEKSMVFPIAIRLMVNQIPDDSITHMLCSGVTDTSIVERYHAWRSGRIGLIKDLILCQDLISDHKKAMMTDKEGVYGQIIKRVNQNKRSGMITNNPSMAMASNLFVISDATEAAIEYRLGGKLSSIKTREKIFEKTYAMIICVIDKQWERITFYHRGIDSATSVGLRDIKIGNRGNGPDVSDILRAYQLGNSPSL